MWRKNNNKSSQISRTDKGSWKKNLYGILLYNYFRLLNIYMATKRLKRLPLQRMLSYVHACMRETVVILNWPEGGRNQENNTSTETITFETTKFNYSLSSLWSGTGASDWGFNMCTDSGELKSQNTMLLHD